MIFSVYLQVGDLGRSLSFYRDGLGLEVAWNDGMLAVLDGPDESAATLVIREVGAGAKQGLGQTGGYSHRAADDVTMGDACRARPGREATATANPGL